MKAQLEHPAEEIRRLQRCITDLVSVLSLPAIWSGGEPSQIVHTFLDSLLGMLDLDLIYFKLKYTENDEPIEMARLPQRQRIATHPREIGEMLGLALGGDPMQWPSVSRCRIGDEDLVLATLHLGLRGEIGVIAAGSQRADFPGQTESLLLNVAANQASIGLQEARLLTQQRRLSRELDHRVAQRTRELAAANEALRKEIAERKQAEESSRRSEAFLAQVQQVSSTGGFFWHPATDEIMGSGEVHRIFELDPSEPLTPKLLLSRVHPEDLPAFSEMIEREGREGGDFEHELRLVMPDQSIKCLHIVAHATRDQDDRLKYIAAVQDVTQRRLSEEALGKARSELAHVSRVTSLGALTASIAHEVNQPLAGIITNASTCLRMLAADPPNVEGARETARRTIRDGNRASEVISRLRALFSKKAAALEMVDLNEAAREVIALSLNSLQQNRVVLRPEYADELPPIAGDRIQLQQVILNLILNASDAMSEIEDRPRQLVLRTDREAGDRVRLSVQDAGVGFEPQAPERLFEAFYTTKSGGMGIGLSVSRSIIERHGGHLCATLNEGPGATFSFSIPLGPETLTGSRAAAVKPASAARNESL